MLGAGLHEAAPPRDDRQVSQAGAHYQVDNGVVTKYYTSTALSASLAGATRIAMCEGGTLYYMLSDHPGSTSLTLNSSGSKIAELRYKACPLRFAAGVLREGETRFSSGTAPTLTGPANGGTPPDTTPTFTWSAVPGATNYTLQVSKNDTFTQLVLHKTSTTASYTPTTTLPANLPLFWHVKANGTNGPSLWSSPTWTFTIIP